MPQTLEVRSNLATSNGGKEFTENDFTKGIDFLADIASFHVKSLMSNKSQKGKRELEDPYIPQPLLDFVRHTLEDDHHSKDSS